MFIVAVHVDCRCVGLLMMLIVVDHDDCRCVDPMVYC